jgi:serine/threonine protein kinase
MCGKKINEIPYYYLNTNNIFIEMTIIFNKYKLLDKIGHGSYGEIYKGINIRTQEYVAIKIENIQHGKRLLKNEAIIYKYLNNCKGIPTIKWFGVDTQHNYMIINLLGDTLEYLKQQQPSNTFNISLILKIGIQILELLQLIHSKGFIHRDIKPDNFLFGLNQSSTTIYIIDFGFCKTYLTHLNAHIEIKKLSGLIGTPNYASINSHNFMELSRRDDLESLGYILLYFLWGNLPWFSVSDNDAIKQMKTDTIVSGNLPTFFKTFFNYVTKLQFIETPDYKMLLELFIQELKN